MTQEDFERFERLSRPLLRLINRITGMETGFITAIDWSSLRQEVVFALNTADLEVREGTVTGWCDTMCRKMFLSGRALSDDVPADYSGSAGHKLGMRTYFALPILSGDTVLGTVCGASRRPVRLGPQSLGNIQLVADSLSIQMEAQVDRVALRWRAEQAEALALLDPLTGLANRRAFDSRLEEELARSGRHDEPIALLMIDVDGFKTVNDTYGHTGGDAILVAAGQILQQVARSEDVAARIGGDEFVLLMPHCTAAGAAAAASRIADEFTSATRSSQMPCTLSIGVSTSETSRRESLVAVADTALYRIKSLRRSSGARTPAGALGGAR